MGPRPACSVCGSKRWRKDRSGIVICEEGHVLEVTRRRIRTRATPMLTFAIYRIFAPKRMIRGSHHGTQCRSGRFAKKKELTRRRNAQGRTPIVRTSTCAKHRMLILCPFRLCRRREAISPPRVAAIAPQTSDQSTRRALGGAVFRRGASQAAAKLQSLLNVDRWLPGTFGS